MEPQPYGLRLIPVRDQNYFENAGEDWNKEEKRSLLYVTTEPWRSNYSHNLQEKSMNRFLTGAAMFAFLAVPAFAQSPTSQTSPNAQTNPNSTSSPSPSLAASQKIRQDLLSAGFTDVKIVSESFVVQAKSKDGDPVLMTIGPRGMSVFEAVNGNNSSASTTTGSSNGSTSSGAQNNSTSKNK